MSTPSTWSLLTQQLIKGMWFKILGTGSTQGKGMFYSLL